MFKKQKILNRSVSDFEYCGFRFVSDFDIRISDFDSLNVLERLELLERFSYLRRHNGNISPRNQKHEAHLPSRLERIWQRRRRSRSPAAPRWSPDLLDRARKRAERCHRLGRERSRQSEDRATDRFGLSLPALEFSRRARRLAARSLPVEQAGATGCRHGRLRYQ